MNHLHSKKGFSLVELLIVIAILATISVTAYLAFFNSGRQTQNEKIMADLLTIEQALEQYHQDHGQYPTFPDPVMTGKDKNVLCYDQKMNYEHDCSQAAFLQTQVDSALLTQRLLSEIPTDPRTGTRYAYAATLDGQYYQLAANLEAENGDWQAHTRGNLDPATAPFYSMIRAYNAPDFVLEGQAQLPYNPDPGSLVAGLYELTGTVQLNDQVAEEGQVAHAQDTINTGAASRAVLYFSDGSIVHLDPNSHLQILPPSQVAQNDATDIDTDLNLKLSTGQLWAKVVNLSAKSEFKLESINAIGGVRGTEFGFNADSNTLDILSGEVGFRQKTEAEKQQSNEEGGYLEFSLDDFADNQFVQGDGQSITRFVLPDLDQPINIPPNQVEAILDVYYPDEGILSRVDRPYLARASTQGDGFYDLFVGMNGLQGDDDLKVTGFELFSEDQVLNDQTLNPDVEPVLTTSAQYDEQEAAYIMQIEYEQAQGNVFYDPESSNKMKAFVLRAYFKEGDQIHYSNISWPLITLETNAPNQVNTFDFAQANTYPEFEALDQDENPIIDLKIEAESPIGVQGTSVQMTAHAIHENDEESPITEACEWSTEGVLGTINENGVYVVFQDSTIGAETITCSYQDWQKSIEIPILSSLKAACFGTNLKNDNGTNDDQGYWKNDSCWKLGDPGQNCDTTCSSIGTTCLDSTDPGGEDWDDDNSEICLALTNGDVQPAAFFEFAPHFKNNANRCYSRSNELNEFTPNLCSTTQNINAQTEQRICKCT